MPEKFAICLLASEVEPLSKTGGLGDVAGALTRYLHRAGHDVRLFTPAYDSIDRVACAAEPVAGLTQIPLTVVARTYAISVLRAELPQGAFAYLIDCPPLCGRLLPTVNGPSMDGTPLVWNWLPAVPKS